MCVIVCEHGDVQVKASEDVRVKVGVQPCV